MAREGLYNMREATTLTDVKFSVSWAHGILWVRCAAEALTKEMAHLLDQHRFQLTINSQKGQTEGYWAASFNIESEYEELRKFLTERGVSLPPLEDVSKD